MLVFLVLLAAYVLFIAWGRRSSWAEAPVVAGSAPQHAGDSWIDREVSRGLDDVEHYLKAHAPG